MGYKSTGRVLAEKPSIGIEPTRLYDASRFKNHGVHTNITMVQLPSGLWVREYDGITSNVDIGTDNSLISFAGSIVFWVKMFDVGSVRDIILLKQNATNSLFVRKTTDNRIDVFIVIAGAYPTDRTTSETLDTNWHQVAVTQDTNTMLVYIDLIESATGADGGNWTSTFTLANSWIGSANAGSLFKGQLALPKFYNYALSAGQIKNIYEKELRDWFI